MNECYLLEKVVNQSMLDVQNNPIGTGHTDRANQKNNDQLNYITRKGIYP